MPLPSPPIMLLLSLLALALGPVLFYAVRAKDSLVEGLDGFVLVAICGMVLLHILPHTVQEIGWIAPAVLLSALLLPSFVERLKGRLARTTHTLTLALAILGIALHAFTDGMVLTERVLPGHDSHGAMLPLAVILHRIPDGLTVWWLLRPRYGYASALRTLAVMAVSTVLGYAFGSVVFARLSSFGVGVFEAIVGGSLLHVILHHDHPANACGDTKRRWAAGTGGLLAALTLAALTLDSALSREQPYLSEVVGTFKTLALESAPALLLAYFFAGALQTFMPHAGFSWLKKGSDPARALKGMVFGLPLPICSCGVVPVYRGLVLNQVPTAAAIAFFVATPEFSIDAFLMSFPLLGSSFTIWRLALAAAVAFGIGLLAARFSSENPDATDLHDGASLPETPHDLSFGKKLLLALRHGFVDSLDDTGPWIVTGLFIAAVLSPLLQTSLNLNALPPALQIPLFTLLGMPLYVCASGATPLVAVLIHNGVSPGAGLAFLLTGPATNATTFGVLARLHGKRFAVFFAIAMAALAMLAGYILNAVHDAASIPDLLSRESTETAGALQIACLSALTAALVGSLLRRGPRALLNEIISFEDAPAGHAHADPHDHAPHHEQSSCCAH